MPTIIAHSLKSTVVLPAEVRRSELMTWQATALDEIVPHLDEFPLWASSDPKTQNRDWLS